MKVKKQTIAGKISINIIFVILMCCPLDVGGQINSAKILFILNNFYGSELIIVNEIEYFGLVCETNSQLPKAKKGKYFCQTEYFLSSLNNKKVYYYKSKYYNDKKQLNTILTFTLDSATKDTIKKVKETYFYDNSLLKKITTTELINKLSQFGPHGENLGNRKLRHDTIYIFYDSISRNVKKGYTYDTQLKDTEWFHYRWRKVDKTSCQITEYNKETEMEMEINLTNNGFYLYLMPYEGNSPIFLFGTIYSKDSILITEYNRGNLILKPDERPFRIISIKNQDSLLRKSDISFSNNKVNKVLDLKYIDEVNLNKARLPVQVREFKINENNKILTKTINYLYSYEKWVE